VPNNYFLFEPTVRRDVQSFSTIRQKSSIPLLKVTIVDLYRLEKIFDHFGVEEKHVPKFSAGQIFLDEIKRWYGMQLAAVSSKFNQMGLTWLTR
jgi:hypothetical protein